MKDVSEVYSVGTFVQIHELQDLGDKLRMIVMAYRRINITGQILDQGKTDAAKNQGCHLQIFTDN